MAEAKILVITPASWDARIAAMLRAAMRCDPGASVDTLRALVEARSATLLRIGTQDGATVGAIVLRIDERETGARDGVIVAAATTARWVWRYLPALLADLERRFIGVSCIRIHTGSRALVRALVRVGYTLPPEFVLRKAIA